MARLYTYTNEITAFSKGATKGHKERLDDGTATYGNNKLDDGSQQGVVGGILMGLDGRWFAQVPAGTPKDLVGRANHEVNLKQRKQDVKDRMLAKLEEKKRAREEEKKEEGEWCAKK